MIITPTLKFTEDKATRIKKTKALNRQKWIFQSRTLSAKAKLQLLYTLFNSRWAYASELIALVDKPFKNWLKSTWYQAFRSLLHINYNISKD